MKLIALNPRKKTGGRKKTAAKKKPAKKQAAKKQAAKKPARKKGANMAKRKKATPKRRRARRNPSVKRTVRRARRAVGALGPIEGAAKSMLPMLAGALSAKVVQRKFGGGKSELENWEWKDYLMGGLGTIGAGILAKSALRMSVSQQQKILEGGFVFLAMKAITTELVPKSTTAMEWLGEDGEVWRPGDTYTSPATGETFVLGESGDWQSQTDVPARLVGATIEDEDNEVLLGEGVGPVTALGEGVGPVTALGASGPVWQPTRTSGPVW